MNMDEYYSLIEEMVKNTGYQGKISGEEVYDEICNQIEEKEPGTYLFLVNKGSGICFEYKIDVLEDQFNLSYIRIQTPTQVFMAEFD